MEKNCTNHPESLALATCKACEKSICLMCVCDEKEGTFCSPKCISVFREVSDWVDPGATPVPATTAPSAQSTGSIFDPEPASATPAAAEMTPPPSTEQAEFEPLVTPGTKWRMIGSVCGLHQDTQAVATCEACDRTLCAMCVVEADNGTFCAECASKKVPPAPLSVTAAPRVAAPAPAPVATRRSSSGSGSGLKIVAAIVIIAGLGAGGFYLLNTSEHPPVNPNPNPNPNLNPKTDPAIAKTDPKKTDPVKVDPVKTDPVKTDPVKTDPVKVVPTPRKIPPKKVEPPPRPKPPGLVVNPWEVANPGSWYRVKSVKGGDESYTDLVLKAKDDVSYTLSTPGGDMKTDLAPFWVKGEESITIEGKKYLCQVREQEIPPVKRWVLVDGKNAGAVLKEEAGGVTMIADRLWDHTVRVGGRSFDCLVVEGSRGGARFKLWYCAQVPAGLIKLDLGDASLSLVDFGDDVAKRPPVPK
jgi:hypothetical protein